MTEYIEREAALAATCQYCSAKEDCLPNERCADYELVNSIPAADVAPVRHGRWKYQTMTVPGGRGQTYYRYSCSVCKQKEKTRTIYCPNCGAKMDKEVDE